MKAKKGKTKWGELSLICFITTPAGKLSSPLGSVNI